ncbi:MAG: ComEC/Rec2 family competence protein [Bryobacteraceae bacterium]
MIKFVFWDVQHGHATYLQTPNQHIAFDLGTGSYGSGKEFSPLLHLQNKWGGQQLDAVVITHPHRDHLDDIVNFDALSPRFLCRPKHLSEDEIRSANRANDSTTIDTYLEISGRFNLPVSGEENPFLPENNGGVDIQMFHPRGCPTSNINNHSIVTVISHESSKMLVPGDNEPASWDELLSSADFVRAIANTDIMLAPHHGRDSGFSAALFKHIAPRLAVVSDGRFRETSATDRYSRQAAGWTVHKRSGGSEERKCVTTRNDGVIVVKFGRNQSDSKPFIEVTVN